MTDKRYTRKISVRFRAINILFIVIIMIIVIVLSGILIFRITDNASKNYARFYSVETAEKLAAHLNKELSFVRHASQSKSMISWFGDEENIEKKAEAYKDMMAYADMLQRRSLYFVILDSLNEYSIKRDAQFEDFVPYDSISPSDNINQWFYDCIHSENDYTLWMDLDEDTNKRRVWINYKVMENRNIRGVFCSALQFDDIYDDLFGKYDSSDVVRYIIDRNGIIKMDSSSRKPDIIKTGDNAYKDINQRHIRDVNSDTNFISAINEYLKNSDGYYTNRMEPEVIRLTGEHYQYLSIAPIQDTNWTTIAFYNAMSLFSVTQFLPPFLVILSAFVVYIIISSELVRRLVFVPLDRLTTSVFRSGLNTNDIYGVSRNDEIGELARTTQKTWSSLNEYNMNLLSAMKERERLQKDLEGALKEAQKASKAKSAFLANMSHEIRTPLNSIMGFSELAMDDEVSLKTEDYLKKIFENAKWLLQIINNILDISKIESGRMDMEKIPFDLHELFTSCRTLIMPEAAEKGIQLRFYVQPSIGKMPLSDPTRLRQVILNLLSNAVKFTNTGMVKLLSEITERDEKTVTMHFEITDSGIGMTKEQIEKIFDPFIQGESGTTRKYGGTGLGLAITKNIVEMMGGELLVESTPGIGSKFSFDLKFDTIGMPNIKAMDKKDLLNDIEKPAFDGEILLCEDNDMNQHVICEHLARVGIKTVVAENGKVGVEIIQKRIAKEEKLFDLIFMDMHMPVMDGLEATAKINEMNTGIPIVALTANIMSEDIEYYKQSGIKDCVGKPFTSQELWRCLLKYFKPLNRKDEKIPQETHTHTGINMLDTARMLEADREFRKELQLYFVKNNQNKYEEIVKAIDEDKSLAHRLAHTLKGNSGQLGKPGLKNAAADIELSLKEGLNVTDEQLKLLKTELNAVLEEYAPLLKDSSNSGAAEKNEKLDEKAVRELLDELEPVLKMGSPDCSKFTDSIRRIGTEPADRLVRQIVDFDFEGALSTLAELKKK